VTVYPARGATTATSTPITPQSPMSAPMLTISQLHTAILLTMEHAKLDIFALKDPLYQIQPPLIKVTSALLVTIALLELS
jgi:hypothetical protein